ncbi:MAG: hypothetical protein KAS21_07725 [Candidatus Aminicenantes bacterium]|nr:hypothetical protein [Candidatus Aminicenantes bacterium]
MKRLALVITCLILLLILQTGPMTAGDGVRGWKGTVRYTLDMNDEMYRNDISFLKLKGLYGQDSRKIFFEGVITFIPTNKPNLFLATGEVKYNVSLISIAKMGNAMVIHLTDGKGKEKLEPEYRSNYLRINRGSGTYSLSVDPGISDEDMGAFGVLVKTVSYMKVTRAFLNKMEEENRKVPFPEMLKKMFPDVKTGEDRESIVGEAFGRPFPGTATMKDSSKDENGGIFSWHLKSVTLKNVKPFKIKSEKEEDEVFDDY